MKPIKFLLKDARKVDLGTKIIIEYSIPTKLFGVAKMVVNGRHPTEAKKFLLEHDCDFVMFSTGS